MLTRTNTNEEDSNATNRNRNHYGLLHDPSAYNEKDSNGNIQLHWAARLGHTSTLKLLIDNYSLCPSPKMQLNAQNVFGFTPLHLACMYSEMDAVELLISSGCDVNIKNNSGYTAIYNLKTISNQLIYQKLVNWTQRKAYIMLSEGCMNSISASEGRYIFNNLIIREISSFNAFQHSP